MKSKKEKKQVFPLSMTPTLVGKIDKLAETNTRSRSSQVEVILKEYLNQLD